MIVTDKEALITRDMFLDDCEVGEKEGNWGILGKKVM